VIPDEIDAAVKRFMEDQIPFNKYLGMKVTYLGEG